MKRKLAAILVMTMVLGITACGGSAESSSGAAAETATETAAQEEAVEEEAAPEETAEAATEEAEEHALGEEEEASEDKNAGKDSGSSIFVQEKEDETAEAEEPAEEPAAEEPAAEEPAAEEPAAEEPAKEDAEGAKAPAKVTMGYSLEKVGEVPSDKGYVRTYGGALICVNNDNTIHMLSMTGEDVLGENLTDIEYIGHDLYVVRKAADNINNSGLVTADGKVLIDFEAGLIGWPRSSYSTTDRFLSVIYTTGETENQDEAIMYATDSLFSLSPSDEDTLYTGYRRIFDLETGKFVENVENTLGDSYCVTPCGNSFFMEGDDGTKRLYNADGEVLYETTGYLGYVGNGSFFSSDNGYHIYDDTGKETYTADSYLTMLEGPSNLYYFTDNATKEIVLIDKNGTEMARLDVNSVYEEESEGVIRVKSNGGAYQLVDFTGNVLFDTGAESITGIDDLDGCFYASKGDGFSYYMADGRTGTIDKGYGFYLVGTNADETAYYSFADNDYTINAGSRASTGDLPGTIECGEDYDKMGLIDAFTGEKLLEERYSSLYKIGGYLAAQDGETDAWEIYKVTGPVNY